MKTFSIAESEQWAKTHGIALDPECKPKSSDQLSTCRFNVPESAARMSWFSGFIVSALQPWTQCLLCIHNWGIWASSENWHLYYRLRQSYGDFRLIEEAPRHLFLDYETRDLGSFLQIGLISGWDMSLLPSPMYGRATISHDGWIEFAIADVMGAEHITAELSRAGIERMS